MKAVSYDHFGQIDVLHFTDMPDPVVAPGQVLVAVRAVSVNVIDGRVRSGLMGPLVDKKFPKIAGADFAGDIIAVGEGVSGFKVGDRVFGATNPFKGGALAEKVVVPTTAIAIMPPGLDYTTAAAVPVASLAALYALRELGKTTPNSEVLIHGCSGGTGLTAIQLAKTMGAKVTGVCGTSGVAISRAMGADTVVDYQAGSVKLTKLYDVIINFSGRLPFKAATPFLKADGRFIEPSPTIPVFIGSQLANLFRNQKHLMLQTTAHSADLAYLADLITKGKLRIQIAATYPFAQFAAAFQAQERGGTIGKNVIQINP